MPKLTYTNVTKNLKDDFTKQIVTAYTEAIADASIKISNEKITLSGKNIKVNTDEIKQKIIEAISDALNGKKAVTKLKGTNVDVSKYINLSDSELKKELSGLIDKTYDSDKISKKLSDELISAYTVAINRRDKSAVKDRRGNLLKYNFNISDILNEEELIDILTMTKGLKAEGVSETDKQSSLKQQATIILKETKGKVEQIINETNGDINQIVKMVLSNPSKILDGIREYREQELEKYYSLIDKELDTGKSINTKANSEAIAKIENGLMNADEAFQLIQNSLSDEAQEILDSANYITSILNFYNRIKGTASYKKRGNEKEIEETAVFFKNWKPVKTTNDTSEKGFTTYDKKEVAYLGADAVAHTHIFDDAVDYFGLSGGDFDLFNDIFNRILLLCGEELMDIDISNIPVNNRESMREILKNIYVAIYASLGADFEQLENGNLRLINQKELPPEIQNKAAELINAMLFNIIREFGGQLDTYKIDPNNKTLESTLKKRIIAPSEIDISNINEFLNILNSGKDLFDSIENLQIKKGVRKNRTPFKYTEETSGQLAFTNVDEIIEKEENLEKQTEETNEAIEGQLSLFDMLENNNQEPIEAEEKLEAQVNEANESLEKQNRLLNDGNANQGQQIIETATAEEEFAEQIETVNESLEKQEKLLKNGKNYIRSDKNNAPRFTSPINPSLLEAVNFLKNFNENNDIFNLEYINEETLDKLLETLKYMSTQDLSLLGMNQDEISEYLDYINIFIENTKKAYDTNSYYEENRYDDEMYEQSGRYDEYFDDRIDISDIHEIGEAVENINEEFNDAAISVDNFIKLISDLDDSTLQKKTGKYSIIKKPAEIEDTVEVNNEVAQSFKNEGDAVEGASNEIQNLTIVKTINEEAEKNLAKTNNTAADSFESEGDAVAETTSEIEHLNDITEEASSTQSEMARMLLELANGNYNVDAQSEMTEKIEETTAALTEEETEYGKVIKRIKELDGRRKIIDDIAMSYDQYRKKKSEYAELSDEELLAKYNKKKQEGTNYTRVTKSDLQKKWGGILALIEEIKKRGGEVLSQAGAINDLSLFNNTGKKQSAALKSGTDKQLPQNYLKESNEVDLYYKPLLNYIKNQDKSVDDADGMVNELVKISQEKNRLLQQLPNLVSTASPLEKLEYDLADRIKRVPSKGRTLNAQDASIITRLFNDIYKINNEAKIEDYTDNEKVVRYINSLVQNPTQINNDKTPKAKILSWVTNQYDRMNNGKDPTEYQLKVLYSHIKDLRKITDEPIDLSEFIKNDGLLDTVTKGLIKSYDDVAENIKIASSVTDGLGESAIETSEDINKEGDSAEDATDKIEKLTKAKLENKIVNEELAGAALETADGFKEEGKAADNAEDKIEVTTPITEITPNNFEQQGEEIEHEIAEGIREGAKEVEKAAEESTEALHDVIKDTSGVGSYSPIYGYIGEWIAKSLGIGIDAKFPEVLANAENWMEELAKVLQSSGITYEQFLNAFNGADKRKNFVNGGIKDLGLKPFINYYKDYNKPQPSESDNSSLEAQVRAYEEIVKNVEETNHVREQSALTDKEDLAILEEMAEAQASLVDSMDKEADTAKKAVENIDALNKAQKNSKQKDFDSWFKKNNNELEKLRSKPKKSIDYYEHINDIQSQLNELKDTEIDLVSPDELERLRERRKEIEKLIKDIKDNGNDFKIPASLQIEKVRNQIIEWQRTNTGASKSAKKSVNELLSALNKVDNVSGLKDILSQFYKIKNEAQGGISLIDQIGNRLRDMNSKFLARFLSLQDIVRYIRQIGSTILSLDTALIDLKKTTTMTRSELNEFYYTSNDIAKSMGVTTEEIISQAASWSRLGYSSKEAAETMAALSSKFASVSPGMDTESAQTGLVSIMKAWNIGVNKVERDIMDNINVLGNKFAETNNDIIEGMERAGATLATMGTSIQDSFALFTGAQEIIQNAETVGTALKTLSLRIRGYDEETEELSNDVIEATGKVADLTKVASNNFAGVSLWADAEQTQYRSLKDYLGDISKIWNEISAGNQTQILEKLFGKRGASVGSAILSNFSQVEKAIDEMEAAGGSAEREMDIIRDSIQFKINELKQTWVGFFQDLLSREDFGKLIDSAIKASNSFQSAIEGLAPALKMLLDIISPLLEAIGKLGGAFGSATPAVLGISGVLLHKGFKNNSINGFSPGDNSSTPTLPISMAPTIDTDSVSKVVDTVSNALDDGIGDSIISAGTGRLNLDDINLKTVDEMLGINDISSIATGSLNLDNIGLKTLDEMLGKTDPDKVKNEFEDIISSYISTREELIDAAKNLDMHEKGWADDFVSRLASFNKDDIMDALDEADLIKSQKFAIMNAIDRYMEHENEHDFAGRLLDGFVNDDIIDDVAEKIDKVVDEFKGFDLDNINLKTLDEMTESATESEGALSSLFDKFKEMVSSNIDERLKQFGGATTKVGQSIRALAASFVSATKELLIFLATDPIGWAILAAAAIAGVVVAIDHYNKRFERAKANLEEFNSEVAKSKEELKSQKDTIEEAKEAYKDYEGHVNFRTNANIDLSDEDYEKFISLNEKLYEMFPELNGGLDEYGNHILNIGDNYGEVANKLDEVIARQERLNSYEIAEKLPEVTENMKTLYEGIYGDEGSVVTAKQELADLRRGIEELNSLDIFNKNGIKLSSSQNQKTIEALQEAYEDFIRTYRSDPELEERLHNGSLLFEALDEDTMVANLSDLSENLRQKFIDILDLNLDNQKEIKLDEIIKLEYKIEDDKSVLEKSWYNYKQNLLDVMHHQNNRYLSFDEKGNAADMADLIIKNLDNEMINEMNEEDPMEWIRTLLGKVDENELNELYSKAFNINGQEFTFSDLFSGELSNEDLLSLYSQIQTWFDENDIDIKFTVGENAQDAQAEVDRVIATYGDYDLEHDLKRSEYIEKRVREYTKGFTTQQLKDFARITENAESVDEAFKLWEKHLKEVAKATEKIKKDIFDIAKFEELDNKLESIQTMYEAFKTDNTGLNIVKPADITDIQKLQDELGELNGFDWSKFRNTVGTVGVDTKDVQAAYDELFTAMTKADLELDKIDDSNKELIKSQLELDGATKKSADAFVEYYDSINDFRKLLQKKFGTDQILTIDEDKVKELKDEKNEAISSGAGTSVIAELQNKLDNSFEDTANEILDLASAAGIGKEAVYELVMTEVLANAHELTTAGSQQSLINLCKQLGATATVIDEVTQLMEIYAEMDEAIASGAGTGAIQILQAQADALNKKIQQGIKLDTEKLHIQSTKDAKNAGKDAGDAYVEAFEKSLKELQDLRDAGLITEREYLERSKELYIRYFKDREKYAKEFAKAEKEYLEGVKDLYSSAISAATTVLQHQLDGIEKEKDEAIKLLEEEREAATKVIQDQIDKLTDQKEAIEKANEQRQRAIDLQKAQWELEKAMSQRTRLVYKYAKYYSNIVCNK